MLTNALRRGSSRRARFAAVRLSLRRAVASSVGQSGMRAQVDITFEFTGKSVRSRAARRAGARGRNTCPFFDEVTGLLRGLSNIRATVILFIWLGGLNGTITPSRGCCTCRQPQMHRAGAIAGLADPA